MSIPEARDRNARQSGPSSTPKVAIIGAGPGGLASALLLASRGFEVDLYEKQPQLGGRTGAIRDRGYTFDIGPTFLMMKPLLDRIFEEAGKDSADYLDFLRLDPMYALYFGEKVFRARADNEATKAEIERLFPGHSASLDQFLGRERARFRGLVPALESEFSSVRDLLSPSVVPALPHLSLGSSVYDVLTRYFPNRELALLFSFQSKYLGMSAWDCPGAYSMLSFMEHEYGIFHTRGGLAEIPNALARAAEECGARIHLGAPVRELILDGRKVAGLELENGERILADRVVVNADFAQAMKSLVPDGVLRKYRPGKLEKMKYSCSTFMMHLGVDRHYPDLPFHNVVFAKDYQKNTEDIFANHRESDDISFYIRNASPLDPTLAPEGKSSLYILVPTPNLNGEIDWDAAKQRYRHLALRGLSERLGLNDLEEHIEVEHTYTPRTWLEELDVYKGATFNLAHCLSQVGFNRPRNRFEELDNCFLVGGGTHPGSGLPTIFESARISSNLISDEFGVRYGRKELFR